MIDVTRGYDYALVHADSGVIPVHRSADARALADAFRQAAEHLELVEEREALRLDRTAARSVNAVHETEHKQWGSVLPSTSTPGVTVQRTVQIEACTCSRTQICSDHVTGGDAA